MSPWLTSVTGVERNEEKGECCRVCESKPDPKACELNCFYGLCAGVLALLPAGNLIPRALLSLRDTPAGTARVVEGFGSDSIEQFRSISRHSIILSTLGQSCPRTQRHCLHSCPETGMQCSDSGPRGV